MGRWTLDGRHMENGTWKNGIWKKGTWEDGIWEDGEWQYGLRVQANQVDSDFEL